MSAAQVAKILGVTGNPVQRWDREGRRKPSGRTVTNRRDYTADQGVRFRQESRQARPRQRIAYGRVSSQGPRLDRKNPRRVLAEFCVARGRAHVECVEEVGGGMNVGRKKFGVDGCRRCGAGRKPDCGPSRSAHTVWLRMVRVLLSAAGL